MTQMQHQPEEVFQVQEPGIAFSNRFLVVGPMRFPISEIRQVNAGKVPGSVAGRAMRVIGWFVFLGSFVGCLGAIGFAGLGMLVMGLLVQLGFEAAYRALDGKPKPAIEVQTMSWQLFLLPLPPKWREADAAALAFEVNQLLLRPRT